MRHISSLLIARVVDQTTRAPARKLDKFPVSLRNQTIENFRQPVEVLEPKNMESDYPEARLNFIARIRGFRKVLKLIKVSADGIIQVLVRQAHHFDVKFLVVALEE